MELRSDLDILQKHFIPHEIKLRKLFRDVNTKRPDLVTSFVDVIEEKQLLDSCKYIVITDQDIQSNLYPNKRVLKLPDSIFGIYFVPDPVSEKKISKHFNLFMNRANVHRQFWFYKIIELNLLDHGFTSYIGSTLSSTHPQLNNQQLLDLLHQQYFFPHYEIEYRSARVMVPYRNFQECGDLRNVMIQTKISVVLESYHERPDAVGFSEKIFRALQVPRPWLLSGATGSVQRLRNMGFDVFDDYVDHSYDSYCTKMDTVQRDAAILNQLEKLRKLTVTQSVLDDWHRKYANNMQILERWHQTWKQDLIAFLNTNFALTYTTESLA